MAAAAVALLSSCENIVEQELSVEVLPAKEQVIFTAGLGTDTKTYLEYVDGVYKTRWSSDDNIFILATGNDGSVQYETLNILDGAGTSTATFAGTVKGDNYFAVYGPGSVYAGGEFVAELRQYQYAAKTYYDDYGYVNADNIYGEEYFPMYAQSTSTSFNFQNLCSILKVGLKGTDYIDNVIFTPNDPTIPVAGDALVELVDGEPQLAFMNDSTEAYSICYYLRETLDENEATNCYISIPPQTYNGGFTLTINSNAGTMQVNVTEDVVFERSQIRAIPEIVYENQTTTVWGLVGDMTGWANDVVMTPYEQYHIIENQYLEEGYGFKFRANGKWDVNLGGATQDAIEPGSVVDLAYDGANMYVSETGYYTILLDPNGLFAYFERTDIPEYVECASYDEVAALEDGTTVLVQGYVMVPYGRGFVMNIGNYWDNCILVYQGTDQSMYPPVWGNYIEIIAEKTTYNNLPELTNIRSVSVLNDQEVDFGYNTYYNLTTPEAFRDIQLDSYVYVKYVGTLQKSGSYYNVIVDGVTERQGSIEYPTIDLTPYLDKKVAVEGWFIGFTGGGKYLKTVVRDIAFIDDSGSTEDVNPGDDIVVTKSSSRTIK